uniref:Uncharacterized protein n=1 Tax=Oryctolagus cuniculus TaxID=9986 RepID=G1TPV0_RABIT
MPKRRALARAMRRLAKALKFFSSSVITLAFSFLKTFRMGMTGPVSWVANFSSSAELSPFLGAEGFRGKRTSLERYSFSRCTLACRDSVDLFRRRGSTEMPIVRATFLWMPATRSSSRLKPRPARTFVWYRTVGQRTMGRMGLAPADLARRLVEPGGHAPLPVLVEVRLQDHAIPAGRHGCVLLRARTEKRKSEPQHFDTGCRHPK